MVTKTISITKEAYDALKREKVDSESFSDVVLKLSERKGSIWECFGLWKDMPADEFRDIEGAIEKRRKYSSEHKKERLKHLWNA